MSPWQLLLQLGAEIVAALVTAFLLAQAHGLTCFTIRILRLARFQGRVFPACGWVQPPNLLS